MICIIKAEGCWGHFKPKKSHSRVCYNPACQKKNRLNITLKWNKAHPEKFAKNEKAVKDNNKSFRKEIEICERVYRPCIGVKCLGRKKFWSINGRRICDECRDAIKDMDCSYSYGTGRSTKSRSV
jgi:hypothetical protein